jgi:hypothetical protein
MQDSQQRILTPDLLKIHTGDNLLKTHMHDSQPRIRMLDRKQQKTRIMPHKQLRILTMLQRILTQEVNRRSRMTPTEKKMIEVVKKKQLQGEP